MNGTLIGHTNLVSTGSWGAWANHVDYATLTAGTNTVKYVKTSGNSWVNMDCLSLTVEVPIAVTGIGVSPGTADVIVNATKQLTATISPVDAGNNTVTWSSSNTAVAEVSSTGLVTANALGSATITATTQDGGFAATCVITVVADPNANFDVNYTEGNTTDQIVSSTDLLQTSQSSKASTGFFSNGLDALTDGNAVENTGIFDNSTLTYTLNTSTNTLGYSISGIDVYTKWGDNGRVNPNVTISYSLIENPDVFISLTKLKYTATASGSNVWTKSSLTGTSANIRTGVAKLKFEFGPQQNGFVGYSEIDVFGTPTSPVSSIKELAKNSLIYSKNNKIVVDLSSVSGASSVSVIDAKGAVVSCLQNKGSKLMNINVPTKGIYLVRVQNGEKVLTQKVVLN